MPMTFLPVVGRELRVAARRRATYWARLSSAGFAVGLSALVFISQRTSSPTGLAGQIFYVVSGFAFLFCLGAGGALTSDCLSEEKRDGTLGLLFLTDLRGYDVVLGKLVATSINSFYRLGAIFPILTIPLLLGGLSAGEIGRMSLVLLGALLLSLAAGMFASSVSRRQRKAVSMTTGLVAAMTIGPWIAAAIEAYRSRALDINFASPSVAMGFYLSGAAQYRAQPGAYWTSIGCTAAFGVLCLGLASWIAPRSWQDRPAGWRQARWAEGWQQWRLGSAAERKAFRTRLLGRNPFFWLAARNRLKPASVLMALGFLGVVWTWAAFRYKNDFLEPPFYVITIFLTHSLLKFWVASESSHALAEERRGGTLELLLSTPLRVGDILRGQYLAIRRQFGAALAVVTAADFAFFLAVQSGASASGGSDWALFCFLEFLFLFADVFTLIWVGLWLGLVSRKASAATFGAVGRIMILPWSAFILCGIGLNWIAPARGEMSFGFFAVLAALISGMADIGFFLWAWNHLRESLRIVAATPLEQTGPPGKFRRLWPARGAVSEWGRETVRAPIGEADNG